MKYKIAAVAVIGVLILMGAQYAKTSLHMGAPDFYHGWAQQCAARGDVLKTWWVKVPGCDPNTVPDCYDGWQELGGCAGTLKATAG